MPTTSRVSAGLRFSKVSPPRDSTHSPSMKFLWAVAADVLITSVAMIACLHTNSAPYRSRTAPDVHKPAHRPVYSPGEKGTLHRIGPAEIEASERRGVTVHGLKWQDPTGESRLRRFANYRGNQYCSGDTSICRTLLCSTLPFTSARLPFSAP